MFLGHSPAFLSFHLVVLETRLLSSVGNSAILHLLSGPRYRTCHMCKHFASVVILKTLIVKLEFTAVVNSGWSDLLGNLEKLAKLGFGSGDFCSSRGRRVLTQ